MKIESVTVTLPVTNLESPVALTAEDVSIFALSSSEFIIAFKGDIDMEMARRIAERLDSFSRPTIFYLSHFQGLTPQSELSGIAGYLKDMIRQAVLEQNLKPTQQDISKFTPFPLDDHKRYYAFALEVDNCPICGNQTHPHFSPYSDMTADAQSKRAGIRKTGTLSVEREKFLCEVCTAEGRDSFTCYLCNEQRGVNLIQYRTGDPADFLCKVCFETVSAKVWDETLEKLGEKHQYDYS